jgi:UDPglucose--hexose-1-phosphate uridylyltransferase
MIITEQQSSFRRDPVSGQWVIISPARISKPMVCSASAPGNCPFCEGHEDETTKEVWAFRSPGSASDGPGWQVRVVPNKYPAVQYPEALSDSTHPANFSRSAKLHGAGNETFTKILRAHSAEGQHEVVVDCPHHETDFIRLSAEHIQHVIRAYRDRLCAWADEKRWSYGVIFKNSGTGAGASVEHSHSQLIALPMVPSLIQEELFNGEEYWREQHQCVFCDLIRHEENGPRWIASSEHFVSFAPFAGRQPFETWIAPKQHGAHFQSIPEELIPEFADFLKSILERISRCLEAPPWNYLLHTAPLQSPDLPYYHWHWEIIPRVSGIAGFEWASGMAINPTPPELAAARLREAL